MQQVNLVLLGGRGGLQGAGACCCCAGLCSPNGLGVLTARARSFSADRCKGRAAEAAVAAAAAAAAVAPAKGLAFCMAGGVTTAFTGAALLTAAMLRID
jgi:hypothetical protein